MAKRMIWAGLAAGVMVIAGAPGAAAQPLGSFSWQLQPYCNRVTVNVRQDGSVYTLDGTDDLCDAAQKAPLVGLAAPNPDGSIGFGLNIVSPTGQSIPVQARISISTLSGTWSDAAGNSGAFAFGANTGGSPRPNTPATGGDITGVAAGVGLTGGGPAGDVSLAVDPTVVQSRVLSACPAGQAIQSISQSGTVACQALTGTGGGDITGVSPGPGLTGGGPTGDVTLAVQFGGTGSANSVARSDHTHLTGPGVVAVGPSALASNTGNGSTALGDQALSQNTTGSFNVGVGRDTSTGATSSASTVVGTSATAASGLTNATALGAGAHVSQSNALVLGRTIGVNGAANGTRVGIGTTAPNALLDLVGFAGSGDALMATRSEDSGGGPVLTFRKTRGTTVAPTGVLNNDNLLWLRATGHNGAAISATARASLFAEATENWTTTANGARWTFFTTANGTDATLERMRIDHDGQVGIGTADPQGTLEIVSPGIADDLIVRTANASPQFVGRSSQGAIDAPTATVLGDDLMSLDGQGYTGASFQAGARMLFESTENWTATARGSRMRFLTAADGTTTLQTRMTIASGGFVGIGTASPADVLHVNGDVRVLNCVRNSGGTQIAGTCASDVRFKKDITSFPNLLDRVAQLRPVNYYWRAGEFPAKAWSTDASYGLVAQEVEAVMPDMVETTADGFKAVNYSKLPLVLLQAVRELKAANDALTSRNQVLEREGAALAARLAAIERRLGAANAPDQQ